MLVGILSDTHGYLDPRVRATFDGVEAIIHAGDVCGEGVLEALRQIAPVYAVRGNNDDKIGGLGLPSHLDVVLGGVSLHVVHQLPEARPGPETRAVIFGHSHRPISEWRDGVLYLNPGAAGRSGFHALQTVALLRVEKGVLHPELLELGPRQKLKARPSLASSPRGRGLG
jgi:putative phosphoesterase